MSESTGLGDTTEKLINAVGGGWMAEKYEKFTGKPCGCKGRKELLNRLMPYKPIEPNFQKSEAAASRFGSRTG